MTDQHELDRVLGSFFAEGPDELADWVLDAALLEIDHTPQRRAIGVPRRLQDMPTLTRIAAAVVIGVLAVGGAVYLIKPGQAAVGVAAPTETAAPPATASPTAAGQILTPTPTPRTGLTGPIGAGRQIQAQTLLADGRVLVAGGYDVNDAALASAAVYDPKTNTFSLTGSMAAPRGLFTATLLADGRVLVAGGGYASWVGVQGAPFLASAELYDPKTGVFTPTGSMSTPREDHTATRLLDGRVLIVGGNDSSTHALASAELYDPKTGTFSPTGSMTTARGFHTATLLADGRVLVAGGDPLGWNCNAACLDSAEVYDPRTGTFTPTGRMTFGTAYGAAAPLADGRVLIVGGDSARAQIFDPKTGTFSATGSLTQPRVYQTATLLADGRVLVAGGGGDYTNLNFLASAELYNPKTGTFSATGSMADARTFQAATLLADGRVLVTGGYGAVAPLASAELYDPKTGIFSPVR